MAILKHIANKNRNYGKALEYLMFQHNEYTQQPLRDEQGNLLVREEYYLDGLNCDPLTFSAECDQVNRSFCKNSSDREIKSHHYIISFDPQDVTESGLTGERAQQLGLEFAKKYFAGHQALVCTHTDGHNESGNIHVHIILNSVRKYDIEPADFTERACDSRAGFKHHLTDKLLKHMQQTLMDICNREHLHQVDLLSPAAENITEREYWKAKREIERADNTTEVTKSLNHPSDRSPFQTQKQYLRKAISEVSSYANSPEEFAADLKKYYNITFKISRGRYSYLHPNRNKYTTGRNLGDNYTENYLIPLFEGNRNVGRTRKDMITAAAELKAPREHALTPSQTTIPDYDPSYDYSSDPIAAFYFRTRLRLVVDLQNCAKAQVSHAYARKVKLTNLQQMAQTICFVQENDIVTREDLNNSLLMKESQLHSISRHNSQYKELNQAVKQLRIVCKNVDMILNPKQQKQQFHTIAKAQDRS